MTYPRHSQVSLKATPYYHVVARCVRRAWLWGFDAYAGKDYSHRKQWVLERFKTLCQVFSIDICAYAVMANHYHLVLHVNKHQAQSWSQNEVVLRWGLLFGTPELIRRWQLSAVSPGEQETAEQMIELWRSRLYDISWFMRCLNENLARRANEEDGCKGRFWEGRFKSQALLDEAGLLTAMAYVDLNPVRAGIAKVPEESEFTSIYDRVRAMRAGEASQADLTGQGGRERLVEQGDEGPFEPDPFGADGAQSHTPAITPPPIHVPLYPFQDRSSASRRGIPFTLKDYLDLVDWTGKNICDPKKRGSIPKRLPTILTRLRIDAGPWASTMRPSGNVFSRAIGRFERLRTHAWNIGQEWVHGIKMSKRLFGEE